MIVCDMVVLLVSKPHSLQQEHISVHVLLHLCIIANQKIIGRAGNTAFTLLRFYVNLHIF